MRSKSVFRFAGTLLGAVAAIALVPNLVTVPWLLTAALSLWVGVGIYFALLDRTPRSYVFLLAGFTAPVIGFPCVDAPMEIFDIALARLEETTLSIVCTTLIGAVVFPRPLGPALLGDASTTGSAGRGACPSTPCAAERTTARPAPCAGRLRPMRWRSAC